MDSIYGDFLDETAETPDTAQSTKRSKDSAGQNAGGSAVPEEIIQAYEDVNNAFRSVDDAIADISGTIRTADSITTEAELKTFKTGATDKIAEIKSKLLRGVSESIKALGKKQATLQRKGTIDDVQSVAILNRKQTYEKTYRAKENALNDIAKKVVHMTDLMGNRLRANECTAEEEAERETQKLLRQDMQELELVDERENEVIRDIQRDMAEVLAMMKYMADEVHANQETIDRIEMNVEAADNDVEAGIDHLKRAEKHQKCSKKCLIIWGVIALIIGIILISVLTTIFK